MSGAATSQVHTAPSRILVPSRAVPDWAASGTFGAAVCLTENVSVYAQEGKVYLRINGQKPRSPETHREIAEFEVSPEALSGSIEENAARAEALSADLATTPLLKSEIFRFLSQHSSGHYRLKRLQASGTHLELDAILAEGAEISGQLQDSFVRLQGANCNIKNLALSGACCAELEIEGGQAEGLSISASSSVLGQMNGLKFVGDKNHISAWCTGLEVKNVTSQDTELCRVFAGARLSAHAADLGLFSGKLRELEAPQVRHEISALNLEFASRHLQSGPRSTPGICQAPRIVREMGVRELRAERKIAPMAPGAEASTRQASFLLELPVPEFARYDFSQVQPPSIKIELPIAGDLKPSLAVHASSRLEEGSSQAVEADVPFCPLEMDLSLSHYALWYAVQLSRGRALSPNAFRGVLSAAHAKIVEVRAA